MSFITESQLKRYRNTTRFFSATESLKQIRNESKSNKTTIFLSHKHDELEVLDGAISFLKKEGIDVYVDWLDEGMPKTTSGETARRIKQKIKENDKFILLASEGAINSKWCNWELGLGDAAKYIEKIALFPVEKDNASFSGAEYLQIYPYIVYRDGTTKYNNGNFVARGYYVKYPNNNIIPLKDWLRK
ncbi:MAG: toll/interleukin-1 receptor domain-containing protein [Bacteroidales bacterium]|jgi:hypothetical protein|nr:toll/interleukin-1 receptor domain-containing protein [Bacteroidales bacterium]